MVISAGIIVGGALIGGAVSAHGAKSAASAQENAADRAAALGAENAQKAAGVRVQSINDATQQQQGGLSQGTAIANKTATDSFANQLSFLQQSTDALTQGAYQAQSIYEDALKNGTTEQIATAKAVMDAKVQAAQQAAQQVTTARTAASDSFAGTTAIANSNMQGMFDTNKAMYKPYMDTGLDAEAQLRAGIQPGGDFTHRFSDADMTKDGGYNFRLQEGQQNLENSALARGGLLSGNTIKATTDYGQNFASNEYDKAYGRFNTDMNNRFTRLSSLAGTGMDATGKVATLGETLARDQAGNLINSGKYTAEGIAQNGVTQGQATRDIGQYTADNAQSVGNANLGQIMGLGTSRANLTNNLSALNAAHLTDIGNANSQAINTIGRNTQDLVQGVANIGANGTLAIGNATANGITGANAATVEGINAHANAEAAGDVASSNYYANGIRGAANAFTNFYMMANKPQS